jgi:predicted DNA-binding transcriptional regulator YafY
MRASRLLTLLLLLKVDQRVTSRELAERLEVSERTIHRDMEALCGAGVPVTADRGARGGWYLIEPYRVQANGLQPDEIQALCLLPPPDVLARLGLRQASEAGWIKLLAALPAAQQQTAGLIRQRLYVDGAGWGASSEDLTWLPAVQEAVWQAQRAELSYARTDGAQVERTVDPLGLVVKGNAWYLFAAVEEGLRTYRVSRVRALRPTGETFPRPTDFDLAGYWTRTQREFVERRPSYPVTVRVAPSVRARLRFSSRFARILRTEDPAEDGWSLVHLEFDVEHVACEWALGWGPDVEVLTPEPLRGLVVQQALALLTRYGAESEEV